MPNLKEINSINKTLEDLVLISGLSGHETKVRDYLKKQLKLIFPDKDENTRISWAKECFSHFGQMFFEFLCNLS